MSFVRPEVMNALWRWRETLVGAFIALCGMYWAVAQTGILAVVGTSLAIVGALIIFAGVQRTRFRTGTGGPGVVQVHERLVTYYGPYDGGSVSIDSLEAVELDPKAQPAAEWILTEVGSDNPLRIPTNAENAEALFDVFAALDGIKTESMLSKLSEKPGECVTIWMQSQRRLH